MKFLAIDLGTSFLKGAVLDLDAHSISHVRRLAMPPRVSGGDPEAYEIAVEPVVSLVRELIDLLLDASGQAEGLVMCSQMHAVVLVDGEGVACSNAITWQDQRARQPHPDGFESYVAWARDRMGAEGCAAVGNEARPGVPGVTLPLVLAQRPELQGSLLASLPDYVLSVLSGSPVVAEPTIAAAFGLLDVEGGRWRDDVIEALGLNGLRFPELVSHRESPYVLDRGGQRLRCGPPLGDHQAALLGSLLRPGELSLNISTGSQVSSLSESFQPGSYQTRPFFEGSYLNTHTHIPAGRSLNALVSFVTEIRRLEGGEIAEPWSLIVQAVDNLEETDLEVDLSFFTSREADAGKIGNIRESNFTVGHVFRAAFESMAANYRKYAAELPGAEEAERLVFSGGIAQKLPFLREMIASSFQRPARVCPSEEDALLGLMIQALLLAERASSIEDAMGLIAAAPTGLSDPTE